MLEFIGRGLSCRFSMQNSYFTWVHKGGHISCFGKNEGRERRWMRFHSFQDFNFNFNFGSVYHRWRELCGCPGLPLVREKSGKFKVRGKSGNFVIGQGNLEF